MIYGVDVSYAQGTIDWEQFNVASNPHRGFAFLRTSYGSDPAYDDGDLFVRNHDECKRLEIPFGVYHFLIFAAGGRANAERFLEAANGRFGQLRMVIDVEEGSGSVGTSEENIAVLSEFKEIVEPHTGPMIIYTNADTWNSTMGGTDGFSGHQLFVANATGSADIAPAMPSGFSKYVLYQYSAAYLPGINENTTDLDVFVGESLDEIKR